ncbi:anti-sigma factor domain-containing protein [Thermoanaerobacterium sp. DL9XJH110]|uniref:anti-sigma factor domain-containing protein n=1 Tax=Thermoanaerobacterium sp. DL9XJH110 TaxID=3386643 RepID=UPI003BB7C4DD
MNYRGTILKLKEKEAIVMTEECDFLSIKRRSDMSLGQQITFQESDIIRYNRKKVKYIMVAASILLVFLISVSYFHYTVNFAYAYVDIDINPSLELVINKQERVLKTIPLNEDARPLLKGLKLNGMPVQEALSVIIIKSKEQGYLDSKNENDILISAALNIDSNGYGFIKDEAQKKLDRLAESLSEVVKKHGGLKDKTIILKITPEDRKLSLENKISMGRYFIYTKMKEKGIDITIEEARNSRVSDILKKLQLDTLGDKKQKAENPANNMDFLEKAGKKSLNDARNTDHGKIKKADDNFNLLNDTALKYNPKPKPYGKDVGISEKVDKYEDKISIDDFNDNARENGEDEHKNYDGIKDDEKKDAGSGQNSTDENGGKTIDTEKNDEKTVYVNEKETDEQKKDGEITKQEFENGNDVDKAVKKEDIDQQTQDKHDGNIGDGSNGGADRDDSDFNY